MSPLVLTILLTVLAADRNFVGAAPLNSALTGDVGAGHAQERAGANTDLTVQQLEKLKSEETSAQDISESPRNHETDSQERDEIKFDAVAERGGELVGHVPGARAPDSAAEHDAPDATRDPPPPPPPAAAPHDVHKEPKVFRGAARLVQPSSVASDTPPAPPAAAAPQHTTTNNGNRRAFNADITRETNGNMDHYSAYTGVQYSPLDVAEYVFWSGDERGASDAIEHFLQEGLMTKEEAISFLQEIKFNIDYLRAHYSQKPRDNSAQQERTRNLLLEEAQAKEMYNQLQYRNRLPLQSFPFGSSDDILRTITGTNYEPGNSLVPSLSSVPGGGEYRELGGGYAPSLPTEYRPEPVKRTNDPMLQTNIIGTSDYDRESGPIVSEEEYEQAMDKLRAADSLYTQYTLEEVIYQLAKMMFTQSMSREPLESRYAMQRFMSFLEMEAQRGQLSRNIEKKVLDVMIAALSDTVAEHPELAQPRDGYPAAPAARSAATPTNRLLQHVLEMGVSEPTLSRAILTAYKDELSKGQMMPKPKGFLAGN